MGLIILVGMVPVHGEPVSNMEVEDLLEMSLDDLMNMELTTAASLVKTSRRTAPATITTISQDQIRASGARSLIELLDIYVPNFKWVLHSIDFRNVGVRGIIGWENKLLILVNGRVMNEKTSSGAVTERDMPMLSDIDHIDVVRGPGSALHGPGAVSMVISIVTQDSRTFTGQEVSLRLGAIERFQSYEYKYGNTYKNGGGLYLYGGYSEYPGANLSKSPNVLGRTRWADGKPYGPDDRVTVSSQPFNANYGGQPRWKFHTQYNRKGFNVWYRATHGGEQYYTEIQRNRYDEGGYWQHTVLADYQHTVCTHLTWKTTLSYDRTTIEEMRQPKGQAHQDWHDEDEVLVKSVMAYDPNGRQSGALGLSWSHDRHGLDHKGKAVGGNAAMPRWASDLYSVFGEYRLTLHPCWQAFLGARMDWQTHSESMFSPRAALVHTPTQADTFKLMLTRSMRTLWPRTMRNDYINKGRTSDPEVLRAVELRYERLWTKQTSTATGLFYHNHDMLGWNTGTGWGMLGTVKSYGVEAELSIRSAQRSRFDFSYAFTKMTEIETIGNANAGKVTAADRGYGNDFALWDQHILKAVWHWVCTKRTRLDTSVIARWGLVGAKDYANYRDDVNTNTFTADNYDFASRNVILNIGLEHQFTENLRLRGDAYNLLYWVDDTYNTQHNATNADPARYRILPPGLSLSLYWTF